MEKGVKFLTFGFDLKAVKETDDNTGRIEGYASTFGNIDLGLDIVDKGAFKATIKSGVKWPILADHNPYEPIGYNQEASEDETGLHVVGGINLDVQKGRERFSLTKQALKAGARAGISIGYATIKAMPDDTNPRIRRLKELKMYEYSLVTFPMNTEAMVEAAKSIGALDKARTLLKQLEAQGVKLQDLEIALRTEAAHVDEDPTKIGQSLDRLLLKFKE